MNNSRGKIRAVARAAAARLSGRRVPLSVAFITTYRCNFTCEYCDIWRLREEDLSTRDALGMIDEFSSMGMQSLSFTGGEPLMRDDLGELISHASGRGVNTVVFTNGSLVEKSIRSLRGLTTLVVSLDGPPGVHDRLRMEGTYGDVVAGIRAARRAGLRVLTNTVLTRENLDHIPWIVDEAARLGVGMMFQPVLPYPFSSIEARIGAIAPKAPAYAEALRKLRELKRKKRHIVNSSEYLSHISIPAWERNSRKCLAGRLYCAVTPAGEVAPCYTVFGSRNWPSGLDLGFGSAFREIGDFSCNGCYSSLAESDFLYSLRPGPLLRAVVSGMPWVS
ncbi:MAG: radical SAM protein [Deltaproteobacteria bacterium]|nr:radical SAM protein [Deltaproteobacteria bacterium]MBZ0219008.1 radical SAM protein [Deltaproteobacteria bacterium]